VYTQQETKSDEAKRADHEARWNRMLLAMEADPALALVMVEAAEAQLAGAPLDEAKLQARYRQLKAEAKS
jgi:hypothetical protein